MVIQNNIAAMNSQRMYNINISKQRKSTEKLSSGYRINRAADDAAGLTISEKMRSQIRGLNQGSDNIQDGISLVQIADGALEEVNDMLHRMTELSIKSANGTNTDADRRAIQQEIAQLKVEIDRVSQSTEFNTMPIFADSNSPIYTSITRLVPSGAADTGHLTEAIYAGGSWHPSATMDFSRINEGNISRLYDPIPSTFSFTCSAACSEAFRFTFVNGGGNKAEDLSGAVEHKYTIDISDAALESVVGNNIGEKILNSLYDFVSHNLPDTATGIPSDGSLQVSHSNFMLVNNDKLILYSYRTFPTAAEASSFYAGSTSPYGAVDCTMLPDNVVNKRLNRTWIHCSSSQTDGLNIDIGEMNTTVLGINGIDVSTQGGAQKAIEKVEKAGDYINEMRGQLGAYQNRLEHSFNNNENKAENTQAAESRIRDTDMSTEMVSFTLQNILLQAGQSMMSQANQSTQGVLSLLQ